MNIGVRLMAVLGMFLLIMGLSVMGLKVISYQENQYAWIFTQTQALLEKEAHNLVLGISDQSQYSDSRVLALKQFLSKYNSPLEPYAEKLVKVADQHNFAYGLLPSIAMVESGLCQKIPENSYNCWGWGIYGKTVTRFASYDEAIEVVARGIKRDYIDQGFTTPEQIMTKYNPTNHNNWLGNVNFFLNELK